MKMYPSRRKILQTLCEVPFASGLWLFKERKISSRGIIYVHLTALENRGLIAVDHTDYSDDGLPRHYYRITDAGRSLIEGSKD